MAVYTQPVQALIDELGRLPGIGPKSAQRIAFHLLKLPVDDVTRLAMSITDAKARVRFCARCWNVADGELCPICLDDRRDPTMLCVVEESRDIVSIEKTGEFHGRYHVLLGAMSPLDGIGPEQLKMKELFARLEPGGRAGGHRLHQPEHRRRGHGDVPRRACCEPFGIKVTRIASGLPVGGDLEYADELTLGRALEGRRELTA